MCNPRKGIARPQSQLCLWAIYLFRRSVHLFSCSIIGRSIRKIKINRSEKYELWELGLWPRRADPFLVIFISNLRNCAFAVSPWQTRLSWLHLPPPSPVLRSPLTFLGTFLDLMPYWGRLRTHAWGRSDHIGNRFPTYRNTGRSRTAENSIAAHDGKK